MKEKLESIDEVVEEIIEEDVEKENPIGSFFNKLGKNTGQVVGALKKGTEDTIKNASPYVESFVKGTVEVMGTVGETTQKVVKDTAAVMSDVKKGGIMNSKLRKQITNDYNDSVTRYQNEMKLIEEKIESLYQERLEAIKLVKEVERYINTISNTPKEFEVALNEMLLEVNTFEDKQREIIEAEKEVKIAEGGSTASASLSALGVAVATLGPTAAMGIATTFGVASTGTAISALSGAAATSASLAWLGGGALVAGGGGTAAGTALLTLAGPIGWTIAGVMLTTAVGLGAVAGKRNKEQAENLVEDIKIIEELTSNLKPVGEKVDLLEKATIKQNGIVENSKIHVNGTDYSIFSVEEKYQAGHLVNSTLSLTKLINEEVVVSEQ